MAPSTVKDECTKFLFSILRLAILPLVYTHGEIFLFFFYLYFYVFAFLLTNVSEFYIFKNNRICIAMAVMLTHCETQQLTGWGGGRNGWFTSF